MTEQVNMASVSEDANKPSQAQIDLLKKNDLYVEGMSLMEAKKALDNADLKSDLISWGYHEVRIKNIEEALNSDKSPKKDGNGNPAHRITFHNADGKSISKTFYYKGDGISVCKSEWVYGALKAAMGVNPMDMQSPEKIKLISFFIKVFMVHYVDSKGELVFEDGKQKTSVNVGAEFWKIDKIGSLITPAEPDDKWIDKWEYKGKKGNGKPKSSSDPVTTDSKWKDDEETKDAF